jgi:pyruvate dehydrogenase E1 component alpha subunit
VARALKRRQMVAEPAEKSTAKKRASALTPAVLAEMTLEMARLRRIDERLITLQRQGRIGFHGSALGEEACVIGTAFGLQPQDWVFPALRQGAIMLHRGFSLETYLAQSFGCASDEQKGRQMPAHFMSRSVNQVSWSSCIGNQIPQAVGAAFAAKQRGDNVVCVGFMGDGATSEADFHYAMTFAGVWKVPCILVCQNNQWAISEPLDRQTRVTELWRKAEAYGLEGIRCDGQDVEAVYSTIRGAADKARAGGGATFVELLTYRVGPHSTSDDPSVYRDEAITKKWLTENDPIQNALARCGGALGAERLQQEVARFDLVLEAALAKVEAMALPGRESMLQDVYKDLPWHLREQQDELLASAINRNPHKHD